MFGDTDQKKPAAGKKKEGSGDKGQARGIEAKKRRYLAYAKEIEAAVKAGKLSKEAAEKKLIAVRPEIFRNGGKKPAAKGDRRGISVEDYRRGEAQIRELVEKGKVSKEDAEKRLIEMRKLVVRDPGKKKAGDADKGQDRDLEAKKRRYQAYAREIEAAVKSGDLSRKEADKKLIEVRTKLFRNGGEKPAAKGDRRVDSGRSV